MSITQAGIVADVAYGLGLLTSFSARIDVVGIYNGNGSTFGQMFADARPLKAYVRETSRIMEHPVETGSTIADHHIINPVEIDLSLLINAINYAAVYTQIRQAFIDAAQLSVKTRTGVYQNMIIAEMPHEEEPEMLDAITMGLRLRQVLFFASGSNQLASNYQPVDPVNSNTVSSGLQNGILATTRILTSATSIASYASIIGKF